MEKILIFWNVVEANSGNRIGEMRVIGPMNEINFGENILTNGSTRIHSFRSTSGTDDSPEITTLSMAKGVPLVTIKQSLRPMSTVYSVRNKSTAMANHQGHVIISDLKHTPHTKTIRFELLAMQRGPKIVLVHKLTQWNKL